MLPTATETPRPVEDQVSCLHGIGLRSLVCFASLENFLSGSLLIFILNLTGSQSMPIRKLWTLSASTNPSLWSPQLPWIEYVHNSITTAATGLSLFKAPYVLPNTAVCRPQGGDSSALGATIPSSLPLGLEEHPFRPSVLCGPEQMPYQPGQCLAFF